MQPDELHDWVLVVWCLDQSWVALVMGLVACWRAGLG